MDIQKNIQKIKEHIPANVQLVAVSKTKPETLIMQAYKAGQRIFGENKVQELLAKNELLPKDIEWHFIGHLQTNKVKYIAPFVSLLHAIDSAKLLKTVNKEAAKNKRTIRCLLQLHIAKESSKFGYSFEELDKELEQGLLNNKDNVEVCGLMGMATYTDDEKQIKNEFSYLKDCFNKIKSKYFASNENFKELSMGMSSDYKIAIQEGSTMVRIGSSLFGHR